MPESFLFDKLNWEPLLQLWTHASQHQEPLLWIINDPERPTRSDLLFQELFKRCPTPPPPLALFIATGSHQFSSLEKERFLHKILGHYLSAFQATYWNTLTDSFVSFGSGVAYFLNQILLQYPYWILVGSVEPHYFSGITGAHKTLAIGCANLDALKTNHEMALHPQARIFQCTGNPVFEDQRKRYEQAKNLARQVLSVQFMQHQDTILDAFIGEALDGLNVLAPRAQKQFTKILQKPVKQMLLTVEGPLGVSLYQAEKAIKNNEWVVENGGTMVLKAPCPKGIGPDRFLRLLKQYTSYQEAVQAYAPYQLGDHKALKLLYLVDPQERGVKLLICSEGITEEQASAVKMQKISEEEWQKFLNHPDSYLLEHADLYHCTQEGLFF